MTFCRKDFFAKIISKANMIQINYIVMRYSEQKICDSGNDIDFYVQDKYHLKKLIQLIKEVAVEEKAKIVFERNSGISFVLALYFSKQKLLDDIFFFEIRTFLFHRRKVIFSKHLLTRKIQNKNNVFVLKDDLEAAAIIVRNMIYQRLFTPEYKKIIASVTIKNLENALQFFFMDKKFIEKILFIVQAREFSEIPTLYVLGYQHIRYKIFDFFFLGIKFFEYIGRFFWQYCFPQGKVVIFYSPDKMEENLISNVVLEKLQHFCFYTEKFPQNKKSIFSYFKRCTFQNTKKKPYKRNCFFTLLFQLVISWKSIFYYWVFIRPRLAKGKFIFFDSSIKIFLYFPSKTVKIFEFTNNQNLYVNSIKINEKNLEKISQMVISNFF